MACAGVRTRVTGGRSGRRGKPKTKAADQPDVAASTPPAGTRSPAQPAARSNRESRRAAGARGPAPVVVPPPRQRRKPKGRSLNERLFPPRPPRRPGDWSRGLLRTLTALVETFAPGPDAGRRAALAAERLDLGVEAGQVRRLRWALRAFDSRPLNLVIALRPVRFTGLDQAGRERYLGGWASSRFAMRREAFEVYRRLLTFISYADPGTSSDRNPRLAAIGYEPAGEPVTAEPTALRIVALLPDLPGAARRIPVEMEADVVVVGSGAGGGVMALELARAGRSVLVVEAGPLVTEPDMPRDEMTGFDRLLLQGGLAATQDGWIQLLAGSNVGGGTTVNWATCLTPPATIREEWARAHGLDGFDGAEADDDLAALSAQLGVAAPPSMGPKDEALLRGARALGIDAAETRINAVDCGDCGSCTFGCPRGAKRSTMRVHLAEAAQLGARILPGATVDQVLISSARVNGVRASILRADGSKREVRIRAPQVVIAAGALRTPGILGRSSVGHAALGRFLRIHPTAALVARYAEPIEPWRGTMQAAASLAFAPGAAGRSGAGGFTIETAPAHPGLIAASLPWRSAAEHAALMADARHLAPFIAITRDADWGRVTPLRSGRARIDYTLSGLDVAQLREGLVQLARIGEAGGAEAILAPGRALERWRRADGEAAFGAYLERLRRFDFRPHRGVVFSAHQMGTARMGEQPGLHVCDPRGRVRWTVAGLSSNQTIRGLYVADSSLFPTALGVNPMVTVMLLARRVARTVIAEASAG